MMQSHKMVRCPAHTIYDHIHPNSTHRNHDVVSHGPSKHRDDHSQTNHGVANNHYNENTLLDSLRQNPLTYKLSEIKTQFISCDMPQIYQTNFLTNLSKSNLFTCRHDSTHIDAAQYLVNPLDERCT